MVSAHVRELRRAVMEAGGEAPVGYTSATAFENRERRLPAGEYRK
jgi:hypothetical protein